MIWLPRWNRLALPEDGLDDAVKTCLVALAAQMDVVRDWLGLPVKVHVTYRPQPYNLLVGGAPHS